MDNIILEFLSYTFLKRFRWEVIEKHPTGFFTDTAEEFNVLYRHKAKHQWKHWTREWIYED